MSEILNPASEKTFGTIFRHMRAGVFSFPNKISIFAGKDSGSLPARRGIHREEGYAPMSAS